MTNNLRIILNKMIIIEFQFPTYSEPSTNFRTLSPGGVYAFYPGKSPTEKPSILVSGADDGKVYVLKPKSWSSYIWHYQTTVVLQRNSRIGVPAVADVDGDGNVEIFVPERNYIHVLTYKGNILAV